MILTALPPVGDRVTWQFGQPLPQFEGYESIWLDSGTSALAMAFVAVKLLRPEISAPEVVLPAYGCPDLIAAAVFAGVKPIVVDIAEDDPGYDSQQLKGSVGPSTIAVLAVNFLGIREELEKIREVIPPTALLIEDNAQWFPMQTEKTKLIGDMVITSFGRGKPASILGGGLLLIKKCVTVIDGVNIVKTLRSGIGQAKDNNLIKIWVKIHLYNLLRTPFFYYWISRLPFITLGQTKYDALDDVCEMSETQKRLLPANINNWLRSGNVMAKSYEELLGEFQGLKLLPKLHASRAGKLLRYPLLCRSREQRDAVLTQLNKRGLGGTALYKSKLVDVSGVVEFISMNGDCPNAKSFADRLVTLPLHDLVGKSDIKAIAQIFMGYENGSL